MHFLSIVVGQELFFRRFNYDAKNASNFVTAFLRLRLVFYCFLSTFLLVFRNRISFIRPFFPFIKFSPDFLSSRPFFAHAKKSHPLTANQAQSHERRKGALKKYNHRFIYPSKVRSFGSLSRVECVGRDRFDFLLQKIFSGGFLLGSKSPQWGDPSTSNGGYSE